MQTQTAEMSFTRLRRIEKTQRRMKIVPIALTAAFLMGLVAAVAGLVL